MPTALDGEQALIKTLHRNADLVLLDVNMPVKDGFEALQEIRSDPAIAHIPVIILTAARLEPMDMQYALNIGADDYVTKPFDRREAAGADPDAVAGERDRKLHPPAEQGN